MCKNYLYCKLNLSLILDIAYAYALYPPPWRRLDLLSTFVLTPIYIVASEEDPDFVVEDIE